MLAEVDHLRSGGAARTQQPRPWLGLVELAVPEGPQPTYAHIIAIAMCWWRVSARLDHSYRIVKCTVERPCASIEASVLVEAVGLWVDTCPTHPDQRRVHLGYVRRDRQSRWRFNQTRLSYPRPVATVRVSWLQALTDRERPHYCPPSGNGATRFRGALA